MIPRLISGLDEIAENYDGFLIDLWGVVHNGTAPFPGVSEALKFLKARGKRVALLSNSPQSPGKLAQRMVDMGLDEGHYDHIVSSGFLTHKALRERGDAWLQGLGQDCFHLGNRANHRDVFGDLGLRFVEGAEDASFVLNTGHVTPYDEMAYYEPILAACRAHGLPMVCANPDITVISGNKISLCAGASARRYEEMGGVVRYYGKPHRVAFDQAIKLTGSPPERTLMIGDGLHTDMRGAENAGIDGLWVMGGLHREELGCVWGEVPGAETLRQVLAKAAVKPTLAVPGLRVAAGC